MEYKKKIQEEIQGLKKTTKNCCGRTYGGFATARFTDKPTVERAAKKEKCISLCVRHDTVFGTREASLTPRSRPL